ncbi:uncharacterized protein B0T15DRAFT_213462 [Chaetomium strumarium]|uniref:Uncharacterized protein n=1 Tax=Chaetomium strumarium TaxID=1170767 RepID=A0AAJ0M1V7_9PEZI|nr:hypothetical protein B0T15DRAFT_213462 [Chaetomium strumarium]
MLWVEGFNKVSLFIKPQQQPGTCDGRKEDIAEGNYLINQASLHVQRAKQSGEMPIIMPAILIHRHAWQAWQQGQRTHRSDNRPPRSRQSRTTLLRSSVQEFSYPFDISFPEQISIMIISVPVHCSQHRVRRPIVVGWEPSRKHERERGERMRRGLRPHRNDPYDQTTRRHYYQPPRLEPWPSLADVFDVSEAVPVLSLIWK